MAMQDASRGVQVQVTSSIKHSENICQQCANSKMILLKIKINTLRANKLLKYYKLFDFKKKINEN